MMEQKRILIAEDDEVSSASLTEILEPSYLLSYASNGEDAFDLLYVGEPVDLIMLDVSMSVMSGMEFLARIKRDPALCAIPVIVCTSADDVEAEIAALDAGAEDFIVKPYVDTIVNRRVRNVLQRAEYFRRLDEATRLSESLRHLEQEREHTKRELESEAMMNSLVNALPGGVAIYKIGAEVETLYSSEGIPRLSGRTMEEYQAWVDEDVFGNTVFEDDLELMMDTVATCAAVGDPINVTYRLKHKDGGLVWVQLSAVKIREEDGCAIYYAVYTRPTNEALLYRRLIEDSATGVLVAERATRKVLFVNKKWREITHVPPDEKLMGINVAELIAPRFTLLTQGDVDQLPSDSYLEFHKTSSDGRHLLVNARALEWNGIEAYVLYIVDQTAEYAYRQQVETLLDRIPTGVSIFEIDGDKLNQTYVNEGFYRMLGTTREARMQYTGYGTLSAAHPDDIPTIKATMARVLAGSDREECDYRIPNGQGEWVWIHLTGAVVSHGQSRALCYVSFVDVTDMVEARMSLQKSQAKLQLAMDSVHMQVGELDVVNHRMTLDPEWAKSQGFPAVIDNMPEPLIEKGLIAPGFEDSMRALFERVWAGESASLDVQQKYMQKDRFRWSHLSFVPVRDEGGRVIGAVGASLDVDDAKTREREYEEQIRLKSAIEGDVLAMAIHNITRNTVSSAESSIPEFMDIMGEGSSDDVLASICASLPLEDERKRFRAVGTRQALAEAYHCGETHVSVRHHVSRDTGWVETTFDLVANPYSGDLEAIVALHNIDETIRAEHIVHRLAQSDYDSIFTIDAATGCPTPYSDDQSSEIIEEQRLLGSYAKGVESYMRTYCIDDDLERVIRDVSISYVLEQLEHNSVHVTSYTIDKGNGPAHKRVSFMYLDDLHRSILCAMQDTTEEWRRDESQKTELRDALQAAQQANLAKTNFLSNMSHEMRTPMNAITGMVRLARDVPHNPSDTDEYLSEIDNSSHYLLGVINDVLDMSRIESGKLNLCPVWSTPADVLGTCIHMLIPAMEEKGISFEYPHIDRIRGVEWLVDPLRIKQVLMNLLNNALKFTPEGGSIRLAIRNLEHNETHAVDLVEVSDTGCGMSEEFLTRIFQPFEQERTIHTGAVQGTGLGLALVKRIVEGMGGEVSVQSTLGEGSTFSFTCPYDWRWAHEVDKEDAADNVERANLEGCMVLLVEDHPLNRMIAHRLLESQGIHVHEAEDGQQAVDLFGASAVGMYDAVLMDVRMPRMDGIEAARIIRTMNRKDAKSVPIIAMTANAFEEDVRMTQEAGMNAHLTKPVNLEALCDTLAHYIAARK